MADRVVIRDLVVRVLFEGQESGVTKFNQALQLLTTLARGAEQAVRALGNATIGTTLRMAEQGDQLQKEATRLGLMTEQYDALQSAMQFSGGTAEQLNVALRKLAKNWEEFIRKGTGEAADIFTILLGPDARARLSEAEDLEQVLEMVAEAFPQIEDPAKRTAYALRLFGLSGDRMVTLLQGGREGLRALVEDARSAGLVTDSLGKKSEFLMDSMLRLQLAWRGVKIAMAEETIPALDATVTALKDLILSAKEAFGPEIRGGAILIGMTFRGIGAAAHTMSSALRAMRGDMEETSRSMAALRIAAIFLGSSLLLVAVAQIPAMAAAIWSAIPAVWSLIGAYRILMVQALKTWATTALPFIALATTITGVILLLEDVMAFFEGRDSLTGRVLGFFDAWSAGAEDAIREGREFEGFLRSMVGALSFGLRRSLSGNLFSDISLGWQLLVEDIENLWNGLVDFLSSLWEGWKDLITLDLENIRTAFRTFLSSLRDIPLLGNLLPSASVPPPETLRGGTGGGTTVTVGGSTTTVNVSGAGDPAAVAAEVDRRVGERMREESTRVARELTAALKY